MPALFFYFLPLVVKSLFFTDNLRICISHFVPPDNDEGEAGVDDLLQLVQVDRRVELPQMVVLPQTVFNENNSQLLNPTTSPQTVQTDEKEGPASSSWALSWRLQPVSGSSQPMMMSRPLEPTDFYHWVFNSILRNWCGNDKRQPCTRGVCSLGTSRCKLQGGKDNQRGWKGRPEQEQHLWMKCWCRIRKCWTCVFLAIFSSPFFLGKKKMRKSGWYRMTRLFFNDDQLLRIFLFLLLFCINFYGINMSQL